MLLLSLCACSVDAAGPDSPGGGGPVSESTPPEGSAGEADLPPPPSDPDKTPDDRPEPSADGTIRTCGAPETTPKALKRSIVWPSTHAVALGAAIIDGKPSATTKYAQGTGIDVPDFTGLEGIGNSGPDATDPGATLGFAVGSENGDGLDNFVVKVSGKNPVRVFSDAHRATALRLNYFAGFRQKGGSYMLEGEKRTAQTPPDPSTAEFLRFIYPERFFGFALVVDLTSDCAAGALADVLGRKAMVANGFDQFDNTILDPNKRSKLQELLVRDGATIRVSIISNKPRPAAEALVNATTCGPSDLGACAQLLGDLSQVMNDVGASPTLPNSQTSYVSLAGNTHDSWSVLRLGTEEVTVLPPSL